MCEITFKTWADELSEHAKVCTDISGVVWTLCWNYGFKPSFLVAFAFSMLNFIQTFVCTNVNMSWVSWQTVFLSRKCLLCQAVTLHYLFSGTKELYSVNRILLGWFLSQHTSLLKPHLWIELFCYVPKHSKLTQLDIQVQHYVNAIYSLGGGHTHTAEKSNL